MSTATIGVGGKTSTGIISGEVLETIRGLCYAGNRFTLTGAETLASAHMSNDVWNDRGRWTVPDAKALIRYSNAGTAYVNHPAALENAERTTPWIQAFLRETPFTSEGIPSAARIIMNACRSVEERLAAAGEPVTVTPLDGYEWNHRRHSRHLCALADGENGVNGQPLTVRGFMERVRADRCDHILEVRASQPVVEKVPTPAPAGTFARKTTPARTFSRDTAPRTHSKAPTASAALVVTKAPVDPSTPLIGGIPGLFDWDA